MKGRFNLSCTGLTAFKSLHHFEKSISLRLRSTAAILIKTVVTNPITKIFLDEKGVHYRWVLAHMSERRSCGGHAENFAISYLHADGS